MTWYEEMSEKLRDAREHGWWLRASTMGAHYTFSPDELEDAQSRGKFRWGAMNWAPIAPERFLEEKRLAVAAATAELDAALERIEKWKASR